MHTLLFARAIRNDLALPEFAAKVFSRLGLSQIEERESSNYPPEDRYFIGYAANASVKVCCSDAEEFPEYPYWVVLDKPNARITATETVPLEIEQFAEVLAKNKMQLLQPSDGWGKVGWIPSGRVYGGT